MVSGFMSMPVSAAGSIMSPACRGEKFMVICSIRGTKNGKLAPPSRENKFPNNPTLKEDVLNRFRENKGVGFLSA